MIQASITARTQWHRQSDYTPPPSTHPVRNFRLMTLNMKTTVFQKLADPDVKWGTTLEAIWGWCLVWSMEGQAGAHCLANGEWQGGCILHIIYSSIVVFSLHIPTCFLWGSG